MEIRDSKFDDYLDRLALRFIGITFTPEQARRIILLVIDLLFQGIKPTDMKARGLGLTQVEYFKQLLGGK